MIPFKLFFEAFKIAKLYNPEKVKKLEAQYPNVSEIIDSDFDPDSLLAHYEVNRDRGDSVTFAFANGKGFVDKRPNVGHGSDDYTESGRAGFTEMKGIMVPVVSFWNDYYQIKPLMAETFKLIKQVSPKFPGPGAGVVISCRDRVGWYDKVEKTVSSEDRKREMELRRKLHTETDPRRKKIYMQMLGMLPQMKKPQTVVSGD